MSYNLIARIGLDPSGYNKVITTLPKTTESISKKIAKSLSYTDLSKAVSDSLGETNPSKYISEVTSENIDKAITQLNTLMEYKKRLRSMGYTDKTEDDRYGAVSERIKELTYDIRQYEEALKSQAAAVEESTGASRRSVHPLRSLGERLRSVGSHVPGIRRTSDEVKRIGKHSKASSLDVGRIVSSLRRVALVSFSFRIAGAAMGRLRSIVRGCISENAALQAQVNGLKSAMGQALAPAINLVVNAMSALLPYVISVSNAIGQLMGALFGSGWTAAANGAKQTASATSGAAKAQKEMNRQLMSFDEINKMSADNDNSAGGGGSGSNITPIESKTPAWLERFKTTFSELFNSEEFKAANIGGKIGMSLQAGLDWLGNEGKAFDWRGVGSKLRENFDSFIGSGWVDSMFQTLGIGISGFSDAVIGFLTPEWEELKQHYEENGASGAVSYVIGFIFGLPGALAAAVYEHVFEPFFKGIGTYFREKGNDSVADFFDGIGNGISYAGTWLKENFATVFMDEFLSSLGLNFPMSPFTSAGREMIAQLLGGISYGFNSVTDKLRELRDKVFSVANELKEAFSFEWKIPNLRLPHLIVNWDPVDNVLANFFGVNAFPRLSVSWYAKGGILNGAQIFGRIGSTLLGGGEAGKEAVLPLESNTGWMDKIAERVVSLLGAENGGDINATIYLTLDGDVITKTTIKGLRKYARANGGNIL